MPAVISVGESATLSCSAVGFPAPDIVWTRDGGVVNASVGIEITTLSNDTQTQSFLTITSATVNLTGMYHCLSITTIEGFLPESVESNPASLTVQGMHCMVLLNLCRAASVSSPHFMVNDRLQLTLLNYTYILFVQPARRLCISIMHACYCHE